MSDLTHTRGHSSIMSSSATQLTTDLESPPSDQDSSDPLPEPLSFPRSHYSDKEFHVWPVEDMPGDHCVRAAWSARLASRAWRQAQLNGDDSALADPAVFTGAVLDSALERLYSVVRPNLRIGGLNPYFDTWVSKTDDAIDDALGAATAALPPGISAPDFFSPPHLGKFVRAIIDWHWMPYTDSVHSPGPEWHGVFRRDPNWSLLGRFDAANLDEELSGVVEAWFEAGRDRVWANATPEFRALFEGPPGQYEDTLAAEREARAARGLSVTEDEEVWESPVPRVTLTMEEMRYLLHLESKGERTPLRDHMGL